MTGEFVKRGGVWVVGQVVLMLLNFAGPLWHRAQPGFLLTLCSMFSLGVAAACGIFGAATLGRNLTPFPHPASGAHLVQSGIYGLMRHPLYTAVMAWAIGWALLWLSWPAFVAGLLLLPLLNAKARMEERWLREQFPEYAVYERRVRRFLPWIY